MYIKINFIGSHRPCTIICHVFYVKPKYVYVHSGLGLHAIIIMYSEFSFHIQLVVSVCVHLHQNQIKYYSHKNLYIYFTQVLLAHKERQGMFAESQL